MPGISLSMPVRYAALASRSFDLFLEARHLRVEDRALELGHPQITAAATAVTFAGPLFRLWSWKLSQRWPTRRRS